MPHVDRDALYYPYIHIRDVNWLKATLLSFPQVRRMVPPDFYLNDSPEIQEFRDVIGARNEPLLTQESTDEPYVEMAQYRLKKLLEENEDNVVTRFSRDAASAPFGEQRDSFQIHAGKMIGPLIEYLEKNNMAWSARLTTGGYAPWYALHPGLGEALMSVIAINIARSKGLDIVTSSGRIHRTLVTQDEKEVMDNLLGLNQSREDLSRNRQVTEMTDELAMMVMTTKFDLNSLSAKQIGELIRDGKDLRSFKNALTSIVETIPDIHDPAAREKRLRDAAEEVISNWRKYKKSLPRFALDALADASDIKIPAIAGTIIAAASTGIMLATGIGLGVGLLTYSGYKIWRRYRLATENPLQYLSMVEDAGASLIMRPQRIQTN